MTVNAAGATNQKILALAEAIAYFKVDPAEAPMWRRKAERIGLPLLTAAIERAFDLYPPGHLSWSELLDVLKDCRAELLKAHPHQPCALCESSPGWMETSDSAGVRRMKRCECWLNWTNQLEELVGQLPASATPPASTPGLESIAALASDLRSASTPEELGSKIRRFQSRVERARSS